MDNLLLICIPYTLQIYVNNRDPSTTNYHYLLVPSFIEMVSQVPRWILMLTHLISVHGLKSIYYKRVYFSHGDEQCQISDNMRFCDDGYCSGILDREVDQ